MKCPGNSTNLLCLSTHNYEFLPAERNNLGLSVHSVLFFYLWCNLRLSSCHLCYTRVTVSQVSDMRIFGIIRTALRYCSMLTITLQFSSQSDQRQAIILSCFPTLLHIGFQEKRRLNVFLLNFRPLHFS